MGGGGVGVMGGGKEGRAGESAPGTWMQALALARDCNHLGSQQRWGVDSCQSPVLWHLRPQDRGYLSNASLQAYSRFCPFSALKRGTSHPQAYQSPTTAEAGPTSFLWAGSSYV